MNQGGGYGHEAGPAKRGTEVIRPPSNPGVLFPFFATSNAFNPQLLHTCYMVLVMFFGFQFGLSHYNQVM
jgi:hypothetical protein